MTRSTGFDHFEVESGLVRINKNCDNTTKDGACPLSKLRFLEYGEAYTVAERVSELADEMIIQHLKR